MIITVAWGWLYFLHLAISVFLQWNIMNAQKKQWQITLKPNYVTGTRWQCSDAVNFGEIYCTAGGKWHRIAHHAGEKMLPASMVNCWNTLEVVCDNRGSSVSASLVLSELIESSCSFSSYPRERTPVSSQTINTLPWIHKTKSAYDYVHHLQMLKCLFLYVAKVSTDAKLLHGCQYWTLCASAWGG